MTIYQQVPETAFWNDPKTIEYFSQKPPDPLVMERLSRILSPQTKMLLDLGCGTGRNAIAAMAIGFIVHMCDPNPAMVEATRKNIASHYGLVSQRLIYGVMTSLPYRSSLFDAIVACGVLHQASSLSEYHLAISETSRVARQGCVVTLNIFTDKMIDSCLVSVHGEPYSFITAEKLPMTLLPKKVFYQLMEQYSFQLEQEICEEIKVENTGARAILRATFVKAK